MRKISIAVTFEEYDADGRLISKGFGDPSGIKLKDGPITKAEIKQALKDLLDLP